jgi:hypothetical protein
MLGWAIGVWPISAATREHQAALHQATCRFQRYDVEIAVTLPHERCASDHNFWGMRVYHPTSLFGRFNPKVVAMLAEIFMLRLEAERRLAQGVQPLSASRQILFSPKSKFPFQRDEPRRGRSPKRRAACQAGPVTEEPGRSELVLSRSEGGQTL